MRRVFRAGPVLDMGLSSATLITGALGSATSTSHCIWLAKSGMARR
jgi:hypothetical protein